MTNEPMRLPVDHERDVTTSKGWRIIVTEEGCVFGGPLPTNLDPIDALVDALDEIERLQKALEYIQRHRMLVGELAYIMARDALGNEGKSYAEIYGGKDDPTRAFINERRAARGLEESR